MSGDINFLSSKNYMKRSALSDSASLAAPATSAYGGTLFITQHTITHNLGYVPLFSVYGELFKDGVIWEALGTRSQGSVTNPRNTASSGPYLIAWTDSTTLTIEIGYFSSSLTGTYPIYWVIYQDYGLTI